ncbi:hypothetical protein [Aurantibacillus circumpalustris]|uniref:hypothetical protein n=1 Tax=Aurantibacillus circumpalustris TaxID=3036359 RepID=UPI00295A6B4C|nr:hypothetical protein [Aurantibacillus circumpalustris]
MSAGHHEEHHSMEQKPVSFTVPFFLATAVIIAVVLFLSLCDPKPHHAAEGHGHEGASTEAMHHEAAASEEHHSESHAAAVTENSDSMPAETTVPEAEPAHH